MVTIRPGGDCKGINTIQIVWGNVRLLSITYHVPTNHFSERVVSLKADIYLLWILISPRSFTILNCYSINVQVLLPLLYNAQWLTNALPLSQQKSVETIYK